MKNNNQDFKQDLSKEEASPMVFMMHLLFEEKCELPKSSDIQSVIEKRLGEVDSLSDDKEICGFGIKKYTAELKNATLPPQVFIMPATDFDDTTIDALERSQMWDCPESEEILSNCKYQVIATDMFGAALDYKDRADMLMDFLEALVEIFPTCKAVYFRNSGKFFTADAILNHEIPRENRFVYFAVNVRFFNIQETDDMLIDSLGMSSIHMPDLQYHCHDLDPNAVVNHAYNVLSYMYDNENPIKSDDPIDGLVDGVLTQNLMWKCRYEDSLIQPSRPVIDINTGENAAGNRE